MKAFGLLGVVITLAIVGFMYRSYFTGSGPGGMATQGTNNIRAAADITGVKNDLNAMANAERQFMALNGRYATLEELQSSGNIYVDPKGRLGYSYSAEISERSFVITARYSGPATGMPELSIDNTMQITQR